MISRRRGPGGAVTQWTPLLAIGAFLVAAIGVASLVAGLEQERPGPATVTVILSDTLAGETIEAVVEIVQADPAVVSYRYRNQRETNLATASFVVTVRSRSDGDRLAARLRRLPGVLSVGVSR